EHPTYGDVCHTDTGHAETMEVVFNPKVVTYEELARLFFEIHDPTQTDGQGPDIENLYRSEIFFTNEDQKKVIEKLIKDFPRTMFLLDEAYYEFLEETSLPFALRYQNVVLTRTFSKAMGIPALRFGYVVALPEIIAELVKVRGPYAVNMMSVTAVLAALKNPAYVGAYAKEVMTVSKPEMEAFYCQAKP
ncbi:aminotransferase class I/II-fold pyridoxal phosphate-dependent enzyme, partial [Lacticaseibacillus rhamnosus]